MKWFVGAALLLLVALVFELGLLAYAMYALLGVMMVYGSSRLVISRAAQDAWRLYKLSSFPYLGLIFIIMCLDIWLRT